MKQDELFCVGQKAFIENKGKVLILRDPLVGYDLPGGKIQEGEKDWVTALKREVTEETNLQIEVGEPFHTWYFENQEPTHRNFGKKVYMVGYKCKYLSGKILLSLEHDAYFWISKDEFKNFKDAAFFKALEKFFMNFY